MATTWRLLFVLPKPQLFRFTPSGNLICKRLYLLDFQDPPQWQSVSAATRTANLVRYRHLPYLYTLHFNVSLYGGTVVRPVFFEFPGDPHTLNLSYQFMWGSAIMVTS